jgi:hypothetical protein
VVARVAVHNVEGVDFVEVVLSGMGREHPRYAGIKPAAGVPAGKNTTTLKGTDMVPQSKEKTTEF